MRNGQELDDFSELDIKNIKQIYDDHLVSVSSINSTNDALVNDTEDTSIKRKLKEDDRERQL